MISIHKDLLSFFAYKHYLSVKDMVLRSNGGKSKLTQIDTWISVLSGNKYNFRKLITAEPDELDELSSIIKSAAIHPSVNYLLNMYENYFAGSSATTLKIDENIYKASHFVKNTGVVVCPYCNRNYIFNVSDKKSTRRLSELDHFYPKEAYPALSMSFYNLVPVCHNCNHIKTNSKAKYVNPYKKNKSNDNIVFNLKINKVNFITNPKAYKLKWQLSNDYKEMFYDLKLHRIYPIHKEVLNDIIKKKYIYTDLYISDVLSSLKRKIFIDKNEFLNTVLSANIQEDKLRERPFSKLTKDIWEDLDGKLLI